MVILSPLTSYDVNRRLDDRYLLVAPMRLATRDWSTWRERQSGRSTQRAIDVALRCDTSIALLLIEREHRRIRLGVRVASA